MLPFAIRFAVQTDLALNAVAAVVGPEHVMLVEPPIAQFGVLVALGLVGHEAISTLGNMIKLLRRWWGRRRDASRTARSNRSK